MDPSVQESCKLWTAVELSAPLALKVVDEAKAVHLLVRLAPFESTFLVCYIAVEGRDRGVNQLGQGGILSGHATVYGSS
jgi:hypothetical protein